MRKIYWDTMLYAYWMEGSRFGHRVKQIRETMLQRSEILCTSLFVLGELLVGPLKTEDADSVSRIERFFQSSAVSMLPYTAQSVRVFADLRARHGVKPLDALHLSICATAGVDLFLTHDRRLHRIVMHNLPFIAGLDTDLF